MLCSSLPWILGLLWSPVILTVVLEVRVSHCALDTVQWRHGHRGQRRLLHPRGFRGLHMVGFQVSGAVLGPHLSLFDWHIRCPAHPCCHGNRRPTCLSTQTPQSKLQLCAEFCFLSGPWHTDGLGSAQSYAQMVWCMESWQMLRGYAITVSNGAADTGRTRGSTSSSMERHCCPLLDSLTVGHRNSTWFWG